MQPGSRTLQGMGVAHHQPAAGSRLHPWLAALATATRACSSYLEQARVRAPPRRWFGMPHMLLLHPLARARTLHLQSGFTTRMTTVHNLQPSIAVVLPPPSLCQRSACCQMELFARSTAAPCMLRCNCDARWWSWRPVAPSTARLRRAGQQPGPRILQATTGSRPSCLRTNMRRSGPF